MDQRIRDFEPLWNALRHLALQPLQPGQLVRSTCEHWTLPEAELARWFASPTVAERDAILAANRTPHRYSWDEPDDQDPFIPEFEPPRADWLQRTTGQDLRDPVLAQDPNGFPAPLIAPLLNLIQDPDYDNLIDLD